MAEGGTKSTQCCGNSVENASASLRTLHFGLWNNYITQLRQLQLHLAGFLKSLFPTLSTRAIVQACGLRHCSNIKHATGMAWSSILKVKLIFYTVPV